MQPAAKLVAKVKLTLTKRTVDALESEDKPWIAWDDKLTGFVDGYFLQPSKRPEYSHNQLIINGNLNTTQARRGRP